MKLTNFFLASLGLIFLMSLSDSWASGIVLRDESGFPVCSSIRKSKYNIFIRWKEKPLTRDIEVLYSTSSCEHHQQLIKSSEVIWNKLNAKDKQFFDLQLLSELTQIEQKTNELRTYFSVEDHLKENPIDEYTVEVNRRLTKQYGQIFSALVFKHLIERKETNQDLKQNVLKNLKDKTFHKTNEPFAALKDKVRLVVSFGLGWEEKSTIFYIKDFLKDIEAMGLPVTFLKKNPFGSVEENVELMIPQLQSILLKDENIIYISLCKGTPELLAALAQMNQRLNLNRQATILGHINLSGMLSGAIFSDFAKEIVVPKIIAQLLKLVPFKTVSENAKMIDALEFMKTSIIENSLKASIPFLKQDIFTINVTGVPLSNHVLNGNSPMKPVIKYGLRSAFIDSANDGFLEIPSTLIPESITENQATLVMDSSHMLSDGNYEGHDLSLEATRQSLYFSVIQAVIKKDPHLAGLIK